ncbi:uncharacterized protein LOC103722359 isoform X2 [Phoenix dactylifera]|uniref:Uncharacterized protein LOC103722359 isoform X2 n=1 Tax=Phoenix dactylifera TaxID=42345 RepID=A0A8B7MWT9_PHODC|nr:uncharacterized protein LOC103722359 isoform X2 [Phoenix dactylifera]
MGKRSYKRAARSEKDNAGCMWGLISMFDFRRGHSSQKLLSNRKHGSGRRVGIRYSRSELDNSEEKQEIEDDFDEEKEGMVNLGMPSVKELMEEEMSKAHSPKKIPSDEVEQMLSDLGHNVHLEKKHKKRSKNQKVNSYLHVHDLNAPASLDCHINSMEGSLNFDLAAFFTEFYGYNDGCQERHADCKRMIDSSPSLKAVDLGKHYHHDEPDSQIEQKKSILQKALGRVAEAILNQKLVEAEQLTGNRGAQSEEFINAVEILNSNKELLLKLIQDPNSVLLKHIQDIQNAQIGKKFQLKSCQNLEESELLEEEIGSSVQCEESASNKPFHKRNRHKFFRNKDQSTGTGPPEGNASSQDLNRIVVLKPSPARIQNPSIIISPSSSPQSHHSLKCQKDGQRVVSHFSLKEIKRKLRRLIGESKREHHLISMDSVLHKISSGSKSSGDTGKQIAGESEVTSLASKTSCNTDSGSQSSAISKKTDKKIRPKECQLNVKSDVTFRGVGSFFYEEAKKHLAEMLHTGDQINNLPSEHGSKSIGRILSLPEYNLLSPRDGPASEKDLDLSPKQTRLSSSRQFKQEDAASHLSPSRQNSKSTECNASNPVDETQVLESNPELIDTQTHEENCIGEALNPKDASLEGCNHMDELSESCSTEPIAIGERLDVRGLELGSLLEKPQQLTPSVSILPSSYESISEKLDRPSPVSVLEPCFSDGTVSPASMMVEQTELPIQPQELHFEEHDISSVVLTSSNSEVNQRFHLDDKEARFEYIKTVLEISGLSMDELLKGWNLNDQFLEPSLFDEVGTSYGQLQNNPKLLFDCINEVLMEMQERFFRFNPWVSFIKPNVRPVPVDGDFIQEVSKGIDWHLCMQFPSTVDQIVRKNLDSGTWINLRFETEDIWIEIEYTLLDDLLEETAYEFWFEP